MTNKDAILQLSEYVVNAMREKPYRRAYTKNEIIDTLNNGIISGQPIYRFDDIFPLGARVHNKVGKPTSTPLTPHIVYGGLLYGI